MFLNRSMLMLLFFTPTLVPIYKDIIKDLRILMLTGEPAKNIYFENTEVYNAYAQSESGGLVSIFKIDKPYELTPIGNIHEKFCSVILLDEEDNKVKMGELGEICFENKYFRGYIDQDEQTNKVLRNGIYHSGDLGRLDQYGNITLVGRIDDLVKINGNRVEIAEIENAVKKMLGLSQVYARVFIEDKQSTICVYYLKSEAKDNINVDVQKANDYLIKYLPYYMLPTYYIALDKFPINPNGKIVRRLLKKPNIKQHDDTYVAPTNKLEKVICSAMQEILQKKIGINDDFYASGGDSISAIELISKCNLAGLTIQYIFDYRTPKKIAKNIRMIMIQNLIWINRILEPRKNNTC